MYQVVALLEEACNKKCMDGIIIRRERLLAGIN